MSYMVSTRPKAMKRHACEVCPVPILPGDTYLRCVTFDGTAITWKSCEMCDDAGGRAWTAGYEDGDMITADSIREWAEEYQGTDTVAAALVARLTEGATK